MRLEEIDSVLAEVGQKAGGGQQKADSRQAEV
jgi:hypothetical protein